MSTINSDFALFDDIMDDVENNLREEENLFYVSPKRENGDLEENKPKDKEDEEDTKIFDEVNERNTDNNNKQQEEAIPTIHLDAVQFDKKEENELITFYDREEKKQIKKSVVKFEDDISDNEDLERKEESKEKNGSSKNTVYKWNFDSFLEILNNLNNNASSQEKQIDSDIDVVAEENKSDTSFETIEDKENGRKETKFFYECYCENCPSSIYLKSNFPTVAEHFKENRSEPPKKACCKKKRRRKVKGDKKSKNQGKENPSVKVKGRLDANLKDSSNPFLKQWLDNKNRLEREKREENRILKKKQNESSITNPTEERKKDIVQSWIDRKRKEIREKKYKISLSLVADKDKPIRHNLMGRPRTAVPNKPVERKPKMIIKSATESKDLLFPKKQTRPHTSPGKRVVSREEESFEEFRQTYLNDETTPTGYTSVKLFVEDIVKDAVAELDKQIRVKRARHIRPNTAARTNASISWRPQMLEEDDRLQKRQRPKTSVNRHVQFPRTDDEIYTPQRGLAYEEWLVKKKAEKRKKNKELSKDTYYSKLENQIYKEEQERRNLEIQAAKKRVNTTHTHASAEIYATQQHTSGLRLEPQGKEKDDMEIEIPKLNENAFT